MAQASGWPRSYLKTHGIKSTAAREAIVAVLVESPGHPSAEDVYTEVHRRLPAVGLTTVYRTLHLLARKGLAYRFDFGDGRARYELADKPEGCRHHHHLVCSQCQTIIDYTDFLDEELDLVRRTESLLTKRYSFDIKNHVMQFYGVCEECRRRKKERRDD